MYTLLSSALWGSLIATLVFLFKGKFLYALLSVIVCFLAGFIGGKLYPHGKR